MSEIKVIFERVFTPARDDALKQFAAE